MSCILLDVKEFALLCDAEEFGLLLEAEDEDKFLDSSLSCLRGGEERTPQLFSNINELVLLIDAEEANEVLHVSIEEEDKP